MVGKRIFVVLLSLTLAMSSLVLVNTKPAEAAETRLNIVGMGDSYSSGAGGLHYYGREGCYKSDNSFSELFADKNLGAKVVYENLACAGAVTSHLTGQIQELTVREREAVDLVILSIGGNDGKFSNIVKECFALVFRDVNGCASALSYAAGMRSTIMNRMEARLEEIAVFMPDAKIVLVGYPNLIYDGASSCDYTIQGTAAGLDPKEPVLKLGYDLEADQYQVIDRLNKKFPGRFQFVSLKKLYVGHENCGPKNPWLRGFLDTPVTSEWWHPNVEGYGATAKHLYDLKIHKGTADTFKYGNLPLACGTSVSHVSTYDGAGSGGWTHTEAIDIPVVIGTKVVAPASGKATVQHSSGYGNYIIVTEGNGREHYLAHLQSSVISSGQTVTKGQLIAYSGNTGNTTGPHLHYEQRVGSQIVELELEGPNLEWNPNFTSLGDRITSHSLESGNCGNVSGSGNSGKTQEVVFYNPNSGRRLYLDVLTNGGTKELADATWKTGWDIIVPIEIDGDPTSELLFYDADSTSTRGSVSVYDMTSTGLGPRLNKASWSNYWTQVVPVDLDGDGKDELIVYSAKNGRYYVLNVGKNGNFSTLKSGTWSLGWEIIVSMQIGGSKGEEVLLYKQGKSRGTAAIYSTSNIGLSTRLNKLGWVNGWTHIVPVDIEGDGRDELVLYKQAHGKRTFIDVSPSGKTSTLATGSWKTGWDLIVPIEIDGDKGSEILLYDSDSGSTKGKAALFNMTLKSLSNTIKQFSWSKDWSHILPVQLPGR